MIEPMHFRFWDAYTIASQWRLTRVESGFALLAQTPDHRYEPCGMIRHHLSLFLTAFAAQPIESHEASMEVGVDHERAGTMADFRNLPVCYELAGGWKLLKAEQHFKLAPCNRLFDLPAGIITDRVAQFARDMGGRPIVHSETSTRIRITPSTFGLTCRPVRFEDPLAG